MRIFGIQSDGKFVEFAHEPFQAGHTEKTLHDWLASNPEGILEDNDLLIIGSEVPTDLGKYVDLLGVDRDGNVVVVELKRGRTPRDTIAQALEYAAFSERLDAEQLETLYRDYMDDESLNFAEDHKNYFELDESHAVTFNKDQRIAIVGHRVTPEIRQTAQFLNSKGVSVTCIEFAFFQTEGGARLISQDIVIGGESRRPVQVSLKPAPVVDETTFLASCNDNGRAVYSRLIKWSRGESKRINWGRKGFASHVVIGDDSVSVCRAFPPASGPNQVLFVTFREFERKSAVPEALARVLKQRAESIGFLMPSGPKDFKCPIDRKMSDEEIRTLLGLLKDMADAVQEHGLKR